MQQLSIKNIDVRGKTVLLRVDFNVPFDKDNNITDLTRIKESLPTIRLILENGGSVILMSHLGRPDGKKNLKYTLKPCAEALSNLLKQPVLFIPDAIGSETKKNTLQYKKWRGCSPRKLKILRGRRKPECRLILR